MSTDSDWSGPFSLFFGSQVDWSVHLSVVLVVSTLVPVPWLDGHLVCLLVCWFFSWSLSQWVNFSVPLLVGLFVGGSVVLDGWSFGQCDIQSRVGLSASLSHIIILLCMSIVLL